MSEAASRPVSDFGSDDVVLPFVVEPLESRGRIVRLGPSVDRILAQHGYPAPVARLVGEAAALTILLGSALKFEGRFQVQTRTEGVVDMIVIDFDAPDRVRGFARFNAEGLAEAIATHEAAPAQLLGRGHLALTIDQGGDFSRYQGVVPLDGQGLEQAAHQYFLQSEQIPTVVRLAVAESITGDGVSWRAGGLMLQFLPQSVDRMRQADLHPGDARITGMQIGLAHTVYRLRQELQHQTARTPADTIACNAFCHGKTHDGRDLFRLQEILMCRLFKPLPVKRHDTLIAREISALINRQSEMPTTQ